MAATDLLDLDDAKAALGIGEDESRLDDRVAAAVEGVTAAIVDRCGPVVAVETSDRFTVVGDRLSFHMPVLEVTSVAEWSGGSSTAVDEDDWQLVHSGTIDAYLWRLSGGTAYCWQSGDRAVDVEFTAGRCVDTESVPAKFKRAARSILVREWRQQAPAWARSQNLPDTEEGLEGYLSVDAMIDAQLGRETIDRVLIGGY